LEQGAKVVQADGRRLDIFDVDAVNGEEGINRDNVHKSPFSNTLFNCTLYCKPKVATFILYSK
jgi:hypothetical protein